MSTAVAENEQPATAPEPEAKYEVVNITRLVESSTNPRRNFDEEKLSELADSIARCGIQEPILVRPRAAGKNARIVQVQDLEIVAGARRFRASKIAKLERVPVIIRHLEDGQVLELQLVENLQRQDLHPLEEAEGYRQLRLAGKTPAQIAERTGHNVRHVYDRLQLLNLTASGQEHFLAGRIAAGHAVLLARLAPADQDRAIQLGALFETQHLLFRPDGDDVDDMYGKDGKPALHTLKACSVPELKAWIDGHVRFSPDQVDLPMLYPETEVELNRAAEEAEKVINITYEHHLGPEVRGQGRTYTPRTWRRADGRLGSKTCPLSLTGVVVVGPDRGVAFKVCIDKETCTVHWAAEQRLKRAAAEEATKQGSTGEQRETVQRDRYAEERKRNEAKREAWTKVVPAILSALATKVAAAPATPTGPLAKVLMEELRLRADGPRSNSLKPGKTAEDLVRYLTFRLLEDAAHEWGAHETFPEMAKPLGVDVAAIVKASTASASKAAGPLARKAGQKPAAVKKGGRR